MPPAPLRGRRPSSASAHRRVARLLSSAMRKHHKSIHRFSAVSLLCSSVVVFCVMINFGFHPRSIKEARDMAELSGFASLLFSLWWFCCWHDGSMSIRSLTIERKSEPKTYRLAMLGIAIFDLAFLVSLILSLYVLRKHAA